MARVLANKSYPQLEIPDSLIFWNFTDWEATGMTAEKKAARHRQWAANAIAEAIRMESRLIRKH